MAVPAAGVGFPVAGAVLCGFLSRVAWLGPGPGAAGPDQAAWAGGLWLRRIWPPGP
jgi:hypothetical protein